MKISKKRILLGFFSISEAEASVNKPRFEEEINRKTDLNQYSDLRYIKQSWDENMRILNFPFDVYFELKDFGNKFKEEYLTIDFDKKKTGSYGTVVRKEPKKVSMDLNENFVGLEALFLSILLKQDLKIQ